MYIVVTFSMKVMAATAIISFYLLVIQQGLATPEL